MNIKSDKMDNELFSSNDYEFKGYLKEIINISNDYLKLIFKPDRYNEFINAVQVLNNCKDPNDVILPYIKIYEKFIKEDYQSNYKSNVNQDLINFLNDKNSDLKIIWGNCYNVLKAMDSESIHLMITSPPYYNAREYSQWKNLDEYLNDMRRIIIESYRVLDNHRVFVFNVGDVFDNDNLTTTSVWGKRRLPLGAYFIKIFEECGYTFVDDIIWDKGEVQSERHKSGEKNYPYYQYPANCYEHILIFHKHRLDKTRFPCPVCGSLKVNGNTQSEIGLQSWECKNYKCFIRSENNRGKRFSLKTNFTQLNQTIQNQIDEQILKKWRRDITKFSPVIKINSKGINKHGHTAPFPKDIPEMAIKFFSYIGEKVLDPFAGSFTSCIEAKELNRIGIGIEINREMFEDKIIERIKKEFKHLKNVSEYDHFNNRIIKRKDCIKTIDDFQK
jgi:DNA modification methylase